MYSYKFKHGVTTVYRPLYEGELVVMTRNITWEGDR